MSSPVSVQVRGVRGALALPNRDDHRSSFRNFHTPEEDKPMANPSMDRDLVGWLRQQLQEAQPDLLREMLTTMVQELMGAEAQQLCGAEYGERSSERSNSRNGYRERYWDTREGSIELAVPKLRRGSYFPEWLLEPRRRAERALVTVIAQADLAGVSTRRVEGLVQTLGIAHLSKSQVSVMAKNLDGMGDE